MNEPKNLIVGCGLSGIVLAERIASQKKEEVLIIDKRSHIGGNVYDYKAPQTGITVHQYGPHVFHKHIGPETRNRNLGFAAIPRLALFC